MNVCFIGHRTVANAEKIKKRLYDAISMLIESGVDTFLFGSKSDFNFLCWEIVTELQKQFPNIKRISYNAPHETAFTSKEERQRHERFYSEILRQEIHFTDYEGAVNSQKSMNTHKNAYIMRNQEMIDNSDVCVFYFNKDYLPPKRKAQNKFLPDYQTKSGTAIAFQYAMAKKKKILNMFN